MHPAEDPRSRVHRPLAVGIALVAMGLVLVRAWIQSATIDECDSFLTFGAKAQPFQWYPSSGNHVLNTIVVRFFTYGFGVSHLTLRSSAIIGAAIFIIACYQLCRIISTSELVRIPLFACLVFNPFVLDYLIAARGYSLALGFLMTAAFVSIRALTRSEKLLSSAAAVSLMAGLSFSANFAFAWMDAAILFVFWYLANKLYRPRWYSFASACIFPGLIAVVFLAGHTVLSWPKGQLYFGASTVREMWHSLAVASVYVPNAEVVNPLLMPVFAVLMDILPYIYYSAGALLGLSAVFIVIKRRGHDRVASAAALVAGALALAFGLYWLMHRVFRILLPMDRTGLFFVVLSTVLFGILVEMQDESMFSRIVRPIGIGVLIAGSVYFLGCLRLSHFREWKFDADTKHGYEALEQAARRYDIHDVVTEWPYTGAMKFYDLYYGHPCGLRILGMPETPQSDRLLYVLYQAEDGELLKRPDMKVIYHDEPSGLVVAGTGVSQ